MEADDLNQRVAEKEVLIFEEIQSARHSILHSDFPGAGGHGYGAAKRRRQRKHYLCQFANLV